MTRRLLPVFVMAGALVACSDASSGGDSTTVAPVITDAPTTTHPPTSDLLLAALPKAADMPDGWVLQSGEPNTLISAGGGVLAGACNEGNQDWRATENNVEAVANGANYDTAQGAVGFVTIFAFPTIADAQGYLSLTREQANCTLDFTAPEGGENGEYNGFGDESLEGVQIWNVHEVVSTEPRQATDADEAMVMTNDQVFTTTLDGIDYSANETSIVVIERYGRIVLTANLDSKCCTTGYAEPAGTYKALLADLSPAVDLFRAHALAVLRNGGLV
jgi:hypothetical protein